MSERETFLRFLDLHDAEGPHDVHKLVVQLAARNLESLCDQIDKREERGQTIAPWFSGKGFRVVLNLGVTVASVDQFQFSGMAIAIFLGGRLCMLFDIFGVGPIGYAIPNEQVGTDEGAELTRKLHADVVNTLTAELLRGERRLN